MKETSMIHAKCLVLAVIGFALSAQLLSAQDLSMYRNFQIGMNLASVVTQTTTNPRDVRLIHQRPAVIQEIAWDPRPVRTEASRQTDPVQQIVFSFYNDELFRIVVTYAPAKIAGLTAEDFVESMSAMYGTATRPAPPVTSASLSQTSRDTGDNVIARWEDGQYSVNLLRSTYGSSMNIVMFSKQLDALARAALTEAVRLDKQEAPQREVERQLRQESDDRAAQEKARVANKAPFRF
jgi:hypothetical protein